MVQVENEELLQGDPQIFPSGFAATPTAKNAKRKVRSLFRAAP